MQEEGRKGEEGKKERDYVEKESPYSLSKQRKQKFGKFLITGDKNNIPQTLPERKNGIQSGLTLIL